MRVFDKAVRNTIYLFAGWLAITSSSFLFWMVAGKSLTKEAYGISITTVNLIVLISTIITIGTPSALSKLIPEYLRKRQVGKMKKIVSTSIFLIIFLDLILSAIIFLNIDFFSTFLKIPQMALKLTVISFFFLSIANVFGSVVYGLQDMKRRFVSNVAYGITKLLVAWVLMAKGYGFISPIIGVLVGSVVWMLILATPRFLTLKIKTLKDDELYKYGFPGFIDALTYSLLANSQYLILSVLKSTGLTGIFGVAMIISSVLLVFPSILSSAVFPIVSELSTDKGSSKKQKRLVDYTVRYSFLFSIPMIFIFSLFSKQLILVYSSAEFLEAGKLLPILSVATLLFGLANNFNRTIFAIGKPNIYRNILIAIAVIFLLITPVLTYLKADVGMSVGYTLTMIVFSFVSFYYLKKHLSVTIPFVDLGKILFSCLLSFSGLYLLSSMIHNIFIAGFLAGVAGILYLGILIVLKFYKEEDIRILRFFSKKFRFLEKPVDLVSKIVKT